MYCTFWLKGCLGWVERAMATTFAPAAAMPSAKANPMPRDAPVMMATLPVRENKMAPTFLTIRRTLARGFDRATHTRSGPKVFWFFFSKKNVFLPYICRRIPYLHL
jgi:hypothetical protein